LPGFIGLVPPPALDKMAKSIQLLGKTILNVHENEGAVKEHISHYGCLIFSLKGAGCEDYT
jgi:hypothetical protein